MRNLAVIFPGMGYHADKPLLYYAAKIAAAAGYEIVKIQYPPCERVDREHMRPYVEECMQAVKIALADFELTEQDNILFISKSIGTIVATAYASFYKIPARQILFTPLEETFIHASNGCGIAFGGSRDQWVDHEQIKAFCRDKDIPLTVIHHANHSLETGDAVQDTGTLHEVMKAVQAYIGKQP